jgi:hypothetical protein
MALRDISSTGGHTTETAVSLRPSPTKRGFYVLCLFDSHFTIQLSTWQMPVTLIRVGTSRQTARGGTTVWHLFGARSCQETFCATRTMRRNESHETQQPTVKARCNDLNGEGVFNRYNEVIVTTDVGLSNHVPPLY